MSAGRYDIEIEQGADFELAITYSDTSGNVLDLSGYSLARMQMRESSSAASSLIELTTANGRISLGNSSPNINLTLSNGDTAALDFDTAFYDLELVSSGGSVAKVLRGSVKLIKEMTK